MNAHSRYVQTVSILMAFLLPTAVFAQTAIIPAGTQVYGEMDQQVTSKKKKFSVGDIVRAHAWRNVVVDGRVVIKAGAPMVVRIAHLKTAKIAGIKGDLELEAVSVRAVDGSDIMLDGGYDKSGKGRKALTITLFALVAWPLIFIKGKTARLAAGTVFDSSVQADTAIGVDGQAPRVLRLGRVAGLTIEVLYDEVEEDADQPRLPVQIRNCDGPITNATVVSVNDKSIKEIEVTLGKVNQDGECQIVRAEVNLKKLAKHFQKGINRFEIDVDGVRTEIILDVEL